jgi:hypothetical protein
MLIMALFAGLLVQPPFLWSFSILEFVFAGQVATAVAIPIFCGYLSVCAVKLLSKRNNGVTEVCFQWDRTFSTLTLRGMNAHSSL